MSRLPAAVILCLAGTTVRAADAPAALEILEKSQQAFYSAGADMKAKVTMALVTPDGKTRTRVLTLLRKNEPNSRNQKYFLHFDEPGDIRGMAFLVWKYPERDDDRWIFIPSVNMVRRVAASDSRSSFVGSDFTYEDISGRDLSADTHTLLGEDKQGDAACWLIESVPGTAQDYVRKRAWIDRTTYLPIREEYYDAQNGLARLFTADTIAEIAAGEGAAKRTYPTVTRRTMKNVKSGHRTEVVFGGVAYNAGLEDSLFTERSLHAPPQKWIR
jgi:hypothetical protein